MQCERRKTNTAGFPVIGRLKLARPRFMDRATPSCWEDIVPHASSPSQGPNKVVPPQRFSYVFQTFLYVFYNVLGAVGGNTDQRFPNYFDVGGFPKRTIQTTSSTAFVSSIIICLTFFVGRFFHVLGLRVLCFSNFIPGVFFKLLSCGNPAARTHHISLSLALGPAAGLGPTSSAKGDNSKATTNGTPTVDSLLF